MFLNDHKYKKTKLVAELYSALTHHRIHQHRDCRETHIQEERRIFQESKNRTRVKSLGLAHETQNHIVCHKHRQRNQHPKNYPEKEENDHKLIRKDG